MSKRADRKRARLEFELNKLNAQTLAPVEVSSTQVAPSIIPLLPVERTIGVDNSRQPRFTQQMSIWSSVMRWVVLAIESEPDPNMGVRARDGWLRRFVNSEPLLSGVLNSVVDIDKNRGWVIEGARDQVQRYSDILHAADDSKGWREFISWQAQSYYTARMGFVVEVGREGDAGPLRAVWSVDPAACQLTGIPSKPMRYYSTNGGQQEWLPGYYLRACSLVSTDETQIGYGFPAVERCLSLAKIMVGVLSHFKQQVLTEVPEGILTGKNISQTQWDQALEHYGEALQGYSDRFARLMSLMSEGDAAPELAITWFRHLPEGFNLESWISILMYGYALAFGYDPREFWPVSMGQLGTAKESDVQHRKATSKGDLDFSLAFQEQLQSVFPASLSFEFQSRDIEGEIAEMTAKQAKANFIQTLSQLTAGGQSLLSREQILSLAAEQDIIPDEYTITKEPTKETDTGDETKKELLQSTLPQIPQVTQQAAEAKPQVQEAARRFPNQPIMRYTYDPAMRKSRMQMLFKPGELARHSFPVTKISGQDRILDFNAFDWMKIAYVVERNDKTIEQVSTKFLADLRGLVTVGFISESSILGDVRRLVKNAVADAYVAGLNMGGISVEDMDSDDTMMVIELVTEQTDHVTNFVRAIREAKENKEQQRSLLDERAPLWQKSIESAGQAGLASAQGNQMVTFGLDPNSEPSEESCATCTKLMGQRMRRKTVIRKGLLIKPGNENYVCGCWSCPHEWA